MTMNKMKSIENLILKIFERDERALGKAISLIENQSKEGIEIIRKIYKKGGKAKVVGFTGPPGAGKSTLIQGLAKVFLEKGYKVAIIAVDPTSPFSGGALLGDRIRMQNLFTNPNVFIRSMATRGKIGGLAPMTMDVIDLLDVAGYDWILVETIGVGQDEVDIAMSVQEVIVILVPGLGDDIQALKAGIMEIGDIFIINKIDREGAEKTYMEIKNLLDMDSKKNVLLIKTNGLTGEGLLELSKILEEIMEKKKESKYKREKEKNQIKERLIQIISNNIQKKIIVNENFEKALKLVILRKKDPYTVSEELMEQILC